MRAEWGGFMQSGWKRLLLPASARDLATAWMALTVPAAIAGFALALLIRAELGAPSIQIFTDGADYGQAVMAHGLALTHFFALPMLAGGFGHLVLVPSGEDSGPGSDGAFMLARLALYLFGVAVILLVISVVLLSPGPLAELLSNQPAAKPNGWTIYPPLSPAPSSQSPLALNMQVVALLACIGAVLLSMAGLAWLAVRGRRSGAGRIVRSGGVMWLIVGLGVAAVQLVFDMKTAVLLLAGTNALLPDFGSMTAATDAAAVDLSRPDNYSLAIVAGAVGLILACAEKALGKAGWLWPVSLLALAVLAAGLTVPSISWWSSFALEHSWLAQQLLGARFGVPLGLVWIASAVAMIMARPVPFLMIGWSIGFAGLIGLAVTAMASLGGPGFSLHDTYYMVAQWHALSGMAALFAFAAALVAWYPAMSGRLIVKIAGWMTLLLGLAGSLVTIMPMYSLGLMGMPRRYPDYPVAFTRMNEVSTVGAWILCVAVVEFAVWVMLTNLLRKTTR